MSGGGAYGDTSHSPTGSPKGKKKRKKRSKQEQEEEEEMKKVSQMSIIIIGNFGSLAVCLHDNQNINLPMLLRWEFGDRIGCQC